MRASTAAAFALRKCCSVLTTTTTTSTSSRRAIIASNLSTPLLANNSNNARKLFSTFATRRGALVGSTYDSSRSNNTSNPSLRLRCFSSNNNGVLFSSKKTASNASTNVTVTKKKSSPSEAPEQQQSTTATSDEMHFEKRLQDLDRFFAEKRDNRRKYPNWTSTISISDFIAKYKDIPNDSRLENEEYLIAGRVMSKREASSKLVFYSIRCGNTGETLQVMATKKNYQQQQSTADASADPSVAGCGYSDYDEFARINEIIRRGDIIGVRGFPGKTKIGELSIIPQQLTLLAPCLHSLPHDYYNKLEDPETRYRNRYLDLMLNPSVRETFKVRAKAISFIRRFLDSRGFVEVDTPILCTTTGGANAKPFHTHLNARNMDLKLRISPELFLKQLVVGGLDRVYEMGRQFRNEGMDTTHNPEFTTCEYYMAYADNETNMRMTEEMLSEMVKEITGGQLKVPYTVVNEETGAEEQIELDFTPPFRRISYTKHIEERIGRPLPRPDDPDAIDTLLKLCEQHGVPYTSTPATYGRLVDKLASHFVEPLCVQPTFVVDHPTAISPLAKQRPDDATITERFELFVAGKELCNAYSELNDPREQRIRFERQQADRVAGDVEAQEPDETFCRALEYGLPPTGGWGIGVDRLVMLLTNNRHIREVILFPTMKPKEEK